MIARNAPLLKTERLLLRLGQAEDAEAMVAYLEANRAHLEPFEPARTAAEFTPEFWVKHFEHRQEECDWGNAVRLLVCWREDDGEIVGTVGLTNLIRGSKQSCNLGYGLAERHQGKGLMTEAVAVTISYAFGELGMHRVEAGYMPHNVRSARLLRKMGFAVEGYARDYIRINGRWQDHLLAALIHPDWTEMRRETGAP